MSISILTISKETVHYSDESPSMTFPVSYSGCGTGALNPPRSMLAPRRKMKKHGAHRRIPYEVKTDLVHCSENPIDIRKFEKALAKQHEIDCQKMKAMIANVTKKRRSECELLRCPKEFKFGKGPIRRRRTGGRLCAKHPRSFTK